jgi:sterol desaturase/sphingolipid hydroxylase (fatty acid hydroxylase superfamily)
MGSGVDGGWSIVVQVLERVTGPFLSFGSLLSITSLGCALVLAIAFIAIRLRRRRRRIRFKVILRALFPRRMAGPSSGIDVSYLIFNTFVFGAILGWALLSIGVISGGVNGLLTSAFGQRVAVAWPEFAVRACVTLVLFLAYEFSYWFFHYMCHRVAFLWEFHKVHHTANVLSPITVFRVHPVDSWLFANVSAIIIGAVYGLISYVLGVTVQQFALTDTNLILVVFIHIYLHFQHSHLWIAFRGLAGRLLLSPAHHQVHHSTNPAHFNKNLGSCLAVWDWMFGTLYVPAKAPERLRFGVEPAGEQSITEAYLASFQRAVAHVMPSGQRNEQMSIQMPARMPPSATGS